MKINSFDLTEINLNSLNVKLVAFNSKTHEIVLGIQNDCSTYFKFEVHDKRIISIMECDFLSDYEKAELMINDIKNSAMVKQISIINGLNSDWVKF